MDTLVFEDFGRIPRVGTGIVCLSWANVEVEILSKIKKCFKYCDSKFLVFAKNIQLEI